MQCKILNYNLASTSDSDAERMINTWLAQGWRIASTSASPAFGYGVRMFVFLVK